MRRPELGSPGLGLRVRMMVALAVNAVLVAGLTFVLLWPIFIGAWELTAFVSGFLLLGLFAVRRGRLRGFRGERHPGPPDVERVRAIGDRLCIVGGLTMPKVEVERTRLPLSWTTAVPWREKKLHVTTGLLDRLDDVQLEAAIAHELGHIANRDATLMTLIAWPGSSMLGSLRWMWTEGTSDDIRGLVAFVMFLPLFAPLGALFTLTARIVARHRELAADRAAAVLTRSPARVSDALLAVSDGLERMPRKDLRVAASRDLFHFVPVRAATGIRRLWATHPPLRVRLGELERLEHELQHG